MTFPLWNTIWNSGLIDLKNGKMSNIWLMIKVWIAQDYSDKFFI